MICYTCHQKHYGGLYAGHKEAVGICQNCGIGVCDEHGQKADKAGAPLLCLDCTEFLASTVGRQAGQQALQKMPIIAAAFDGFPYRNSENGKATDNKRVREEIRYG